MVVDEGEHGHGCNGALAPLMESLARRAAAEQFGPVIGRDVGFVRRMLPAVERYVRYFSPQVRGIENLPASGPVLVVGNHSGVFYMPDTWLTALAITARRGVDAPAYGLIHNLFFAIPVVGPSMRRLGGVPASGDEAERVLSRGRAPPRLSGRRHGGVPPVVGPKPDRVLGPYRLHPSGPPHRRAGRACRRLRRPPIPGGAVTRRASGSCARIGASSDQSIPDPSRTVGCDFCSDPTSTAARRGHRRIHASYRLESPGTGCSRGSRNRCCVLRGDHTGYAGHP